MTTPETMSSSASRKFKKNRNRPFARDSRLYSRKKPSRMPKPMAVSRAELRNAVVEIPLMPEAASGS